MAAERTDVVVRPSSSLRPLILEGCSREPLIALQNPKLFIASQSVDFLAVDMLAGPCLSSSFLERNNLASAGNTCSYSTTYPSYSGFNTEVLAFAIVEDSPVDVLLPTYWFTHRSLEPGELLMILSTNFFNHTRPGHEQSNHKYRDIIDKTPALNVHIDIVLKDYVIPETAIHDTVPSHVGTLEGTSSSPMAPLPQMHGYQYLKSLFYGDRFAGSDIYAFHYNQSVVFDLLHAHGLQHHPELNLRENRNKLLQHVLHGDCFADIEDDAHRSNELQSYGCSSVNKNHSSAQDIRQSCQRVLASSTASQLNCDNLISVSESIGLVGPFHSPKNLRQRLLIGIARHIEISIAGIARRAPIQRHFDPLNDLFHGFDRLTKGALLAVLERHAIPMPSMRGTVSRTVLIKLILQHIGDGSCLRNRTRTACDEIAESVAPGMTFDEANILLQKNYLFKSLKHILNKKSMLGMLELHNIEHDHCDTYSGLKRSLQRHITTLKAEFERQNRSRVGEESERRRQYEIDNWPTPVPSSLKDRLVDMFNSETSSAVLTSSCCASCSSNCRTASLHKISQHEIDLRPLIRPDLSIDTESAERDLFWLDGVGPSFSVPTHPGLSANIVINPEGVTLNASGHFYDLALCDTCYNALKRSQIPPLALANHFVR